MLWENLIYVGQSDVWWTSLVLNTLEYSKVIVGKKKKNCVNHGTSPGVKEVWCHGKTLGSLGPNLWTTHCDSRQHCCSCNTFFVLMLNHLECNLFFCGLQILTKLPLIIPMHPTKFGFIWPSQYHSFTSNHWISPSRVWLIPQESASLHKEYVDQFQWLESRAHYHASCILTKLTIHCLGGNSEGQALII